MRYFSRFGEQESAVVSLLIVSIVLNLGFGILVPFIPIFALNIGASVTVIGFIISAFTVGRAMASASAGAYSDRVGRKRVMLIGTLIYGFTTALMALATTWKGLFFLRVIEGVAVGIVWPTAQAHLVDIVPKHRVGEATGLYTTTMTLGFFIGPLAGSGAFFLVELLGGTKMQALSAPFYSTGIMAFIASWLIFVMIHDVKSDPTDGNLIMDNIYPSATTQPTISNPGREYKKYYTITFFNGMAIGFIIPIFALFFIDVHGFNEGLIGVIIGISGGIMTLFAGPSGYFADRWGRRPLMILGLPLMVIGTVLLGLATTLLSASLIFWIRSVGMGLYMPSFRSLQADVVLPHERGAIFGKTQTWFNTGAVFGPLIGTFIYDIMSGKVINIGGMSFIGEAIPFFLTGIFHVLMMVVVLQLQFPSSFVPSAGGIQSSHTDQDQTTQG